MSSENIRRGRTAPKQAIPRDRGPAKDDPPPACGSPYTDNLALALSATATTMATQNFSLFNYAHPFYALIDSEIVLVKSGMGSPSWTIVRGQLGTTAAAHILGAAVTVAQTSATDSPISNVDIGDLGVSDPANAIANYIPGQGNDIGPLQGVDWEATLPTFTSTTLNYEDTSPQINLKSVPGGGTITGLFLPTLRPFKTTCLRLFNLTGTAVTISGPLGGFHNTGGGSYSLTANNGYGEWCFDPKTQGLYQINGSAN